MSRSQIIRFLIIKSIGNFLLLFSIFGIFATFGPALLHEAKFQIAKARGVRYIVSNEILKKVEDVQSGVRDDKDNPTSPLGQILKQPQATPPPEPGSFGNILNGPKEQILIPKDTDFNILIPKVGANEKVFPNVDPNNENEFLPILYKGVAHAKGSVFPGMKGNIYLFAHSSDNFWDVGRYNAVFYLLKDLKVGDNIVIFFENRRHDYIVSETKVLDASDVTLLVGSQNQKEERLILQTCWPPGTTWKRLLVLARPK